MNFIACFLLIDNLSQFIGFSVSPFNGFRVLVFQGNRHRPRQQSTAPALAQPLCASCVPTQPIVAILKLQRDDSKDVEC